MKLLRIECEQCQGQGTKELECGFVTVPCYLCKGQGSYIQEFPDDYESDDYLEGWIDDN
jgi:DnaJ-class molecular chaperone